MKLVRITLLLALLAAAGLTPACARSAGPGRLVRGARVPERHSKAPAEARSRACARRKSYGPIVYPKFMKGGEKPEIAPEKPPIAYLDRNEKPGTIIVDTGGRKLYYVLPGNKAYAYPISVGRDGFTWTGRQRSAGSLLGRRGRRHPRCVSVKRACR
ncbi:MAG: hypothetical protein R3D67_13490 [Hyphomicrobiaceae bacterium]